MIISHDFLPPSKPGNRVRGSSAGFIGARWWQLNQDPRVRGPTCKSGSCKGGLSHSRCIGYGLKSILRSDEEKELVQRRREEQRNLAVNNISQTFVKNAFYFL